MDLSEYEATVMKLYRQVLYMEEEETPPRVKLEPTSIDLGTVGYLKSATRALVVRNIGKVRSAIFDHIDWD